MIEWLTDIRIQSAFIGGGSGALITLIVTWIKSYCDIKKELQSHWAFIGAEVEICGEHAKTFLRDNKKAPLYRLPLTAYKNSFPFIISRGKLAKDDIDNIVSFFNAVDTFNRGMDYASLMEMQGNQKNLDSQYNRNKLKAERISKYSASLYEDAVKTMKKYV